MYSIFTSKAARIDNLSGMFFKYAEDALAKALNQIFNLLINVTYVWYVLKVARIVAIFKKDLKRSPLSLPTIASEII